MVFPVGCTGDRWRVAALAALIGSLLLTPLLAYGGDRPAAANSTPVSTQQYIIAIPTTLPGYFDDDALPETSEGLYRLRGWIRVGEAIVVDDARPPTAKDPLARRVITGLHALLAAYQAGDAEAVAALYDRASRAKVAAKLADARVRESWLASVRQVESFEPLMVWQADGDYHCLMYMTTRLPNGSTVKVPFAVMFDAEFRLRVGQMTQAMHANLMRFFKNPTQRPEALLANSSFLKSQLGKGRGK